MFKTLNPLLLGVSGHQSEIIELALTFGFRGLDLDIKEFTERAEKHGMPYARRLIDSARTRLGMQLGSCELPLEWDTEDEKFKEQLAKLPEYLQVAADVGCIRCLAVIEPAGDMRPYHENFEFHRHRLSDVAKVLDSFGVRLGLGFRAAHDLRKDQAFQFIHEMEALSLLVKMIDAPNVGILFDTWDLHVSGGSADQIRAMTGEQIVAVRVADMRADEPAEEVTEASRVLPHPTGQVDVAGYLRVLAEIGYEGPVTAAPSRSSLKGMRRDPIVQRTGKSLTEAWTAAELTPEGKLAVAAES